MNSGTSQKTSPLNLFAIDFRSLAAFRIAMGVLLLVDLAIRAADLNVMYTDDGMFSRAEICRRATSIWNWSFHFGSGAWGYQAMLFAIAAGLALALLIGFETRLATIGSWLMVISVHHRVPPILSGAEILLRMLLFWAMFLPLGQVWSLDYWREKRRGAAGSHYGGGRVLSIASAAILLQMALMYLFSAISKSNPVWMHGEAIAGVMAHDFYASPLGAYLLRFPRLLSGMTVGTFALEWAAPLFLFFPKGTPRLRLGIIAALALMHIAISVCLEVGLFSHVCLVGLILFLPSEFWNSRWLSRFSQSFQQAVSSEESQKYRLWNSFPAYYAAQGICLVLLVYVFAINLNSLPSHPMAPLAPERWKPLTTAFGLGQRWGMFESIPSKDGWYVARAKLRDGSEVDLLRQGAPLDWRRPEFPARNYPNHFWQKLFREMAYDDEQGFQVLRAPVAKYFCRHWNAQKPVDKQIDEFEFIYCTENKSAAASPSLREQLVFLDLSEP